MATTTRTATTATTITETVERRGWRIGDLPALDVPDCENPHHTAAQNALYDALGHMLDTLVMWPAYKAATPAQRRRMRQTFVRAGTDLMALLALDPQPSEAERNPRLAADWNAFQERRRALGYAV